MSESITDDRGARAREARRWVVRERSGTPLALDDLEQLHAWLKDKDNLRAFVAERQAWCDLDVVAPAFVPAAASARRPSVRRRRRLVGFSTAACLALAAMPAIRWVQADFATAAGQIETMRLPDGSRAVLDSDSAINVVYSREERLIRLLRGRAWFDVRHGDPRPFRVSARQGMVQDIGTAFEVEQISEGTGVAVTQGAVRAVAEPGAAAVLKAGERARMKDGRIKLLEALAVDQVAAWRRGEIVLRDMPLYQAIRVVGRYRRAPVYVWGDLSRDAPVSGNFRTDRPEDALATLVTMRGMTRMDLPGGIVVLRSGRSR